MNMPKWRFDLVDKMERNSEISSNGKRYIRCPYCGKLDFLGGNRGVVDRMISENGAAFDGVIRPAVRHSATVYDEHRDCYGVCAHCELCLTHFFIFDVQDCDTLTFVKSYDDILIKDICSMRRTIGKHHDDSIVFINLLLHRMIFQYCKAIPMDRKFGLLSDNE